MGFRRVPKRVIIQGNDTLARSHIGEANSLLNLCETQAGFQNLQQFQMVRNLEDGSRIIARIYAGLSDVIITSPFVPKPITEPIIELEPGLFLTAVISSADPAIFYHVRFVPKPDGGCSVLGVTQEALVSHRHTKRVKARSQLASVRTYHGVASGFGGSATASVFIGGKTFDPFDGFSSRPEKVSLVYERIEEEVEIEGETIIKVFWRFCLDILRDTLNFFVFEINEEGFEFSKQKTITYSEIGFPVFEKLDYISITHRLINESTCEPFPPDTYIYGPSVLSNMDWLRLSERGLVGMKNGNVTFHITRQTCTLDVLEEDEEGNPLPEETIAIPVDASKSAYHMPTQWLSESSDTGILHGLGWSGTGEATKVDCAPVSSYAECPPGSGTIVTTQIKTSSASIEVTNEGAYDAYGIETGESSREVTLQHTCQDSTSTEYSYAEFLNSFFIGPMIVMRRLRIRNLLGAGHSVTFDIKPIKVIKLCGTDFYFEEEDSLLSTLAIEYDHSSKRQSSVADDRDCSGYMFGVAVMADDENRIFGVRNDGIPYDATDRLCADILSQAEHFFSEEGLGRDGTVRGAFHSIFV